MFCCWGHLQTSCKIFHYIDSRCFKRIWWLTQALKTQKAHSFKMLYFIASGFALFWNLCVVVSIFLCLLWEGRESERLLAGWDRSVSPKFETFFVILLIVWCASNIIKEFWCCRPGNMPQSKNLKKKTSASLEVFPDVWSSVPDFTCGQAPLHTHYSYGYHAFITVHTTKYLCLCPVFNFVI